MNQLGPKSPAICRAKAGFERHRANLGTPRPNLVAARPKLAKIRPLSGRSGHSLTTRNICQHWIDVGPSRSKSPDLNLGLIWHPPGPDLANTGTFRPSSAKLSRIWAKPGPNRSNIGRNPARIGGIWASVGPNRVKFDSIGPTPVEFAQIWPHPGQLWPKRSGQVWPDRAEFGRNLPKLAHIRTMLANAQAKIGLRSERLRPRNGHRTKGQLPSGAPPRSGWQCDARSGFFERPRWPVSFSAP